MTNTIRKDRFGLLEADMEGVRLRRSSQDHAALETDIGAILEAANELKGRDISVWHCCTPEGEGYWTISDGKSKRYRKSAYELEQYGGAWSMSVWARLYAAQECLNGYLDKIAARLGEYKKKRISVEIRQLYVQAIIRHCDDAYYGEAAAEFVDRSSSEYEEKYAKEIERHSEHEDTFEYYNHMGNDEYFIAKGAIYGAISGIYADRERLEACGEWDRAKAIIDKLYDVYYDRDGK